MRMRKREGVEAVPHLLMFPGKHTVHLHPRLDDKGVGVPFCVHGCMLLAEHILCDSCSMALGLFIPPLMRA